MLEKLIKTIANQDTGSEFTYSMVVADNDCEKSAEPVVRRLLKDASTKITYCVEPQRNIAMARNSALRHAEGSLIAFVDDDELPSSRWLINLLQTMEKCGADAALGPVKPCFENSPPEWMIRGKFFDRPDYATGYKVPWHECRTGNVLFKRSILDEMDSAFDPKFDTAGEDVDFFRRAADQGAVFVWCREAVVHESVPASRCTSRYLLRRALLRGGNFWKHPKHRVRNAMHSLLAAPVYVVALPFIALRGRAFFMKYLVKVVYHSARLLAYAGVRVNAGRG